MFKFWNKKITSKTIEKDDFNVSSKMNINTLISQMKKADGDFKKVNNIVFGELTQIRNKDDNSYINNNHIRFNYLLLKNEYVDYKYIALQIYLLQPETDGFEYWQISECVVNLIQFIQDSLLEKITITFQNTLYISGATNNFVTINGRKVPRVFVLEKNPGGITLSLKDINIKLKNIKMLALYKQVINHFDEVLLNLLNTKKQVLLENIFLIKWSNSYDIVVSKKFLFDEYKKRAYNLVLKFKTISKSKDKGDQESFSKVKETSKSHKKLVYKTQQIFVPKKDLDLQSKNKILKQVKKLIVKSKKTPGGANKKVKATKKIAPTPLVKLPSRQKSQHKANVAKQKSTKEQKINLNIDQKNNFDFSALRSEIKDINSKMDNIAFDLGSKKHKAKKE